MPKNETKRRPDAIRCPRQWPNQRGMDRDVLRNRILGPILGSRRVCSRELMQMNESMVTIHTVVDATLLYPHGHPLQLEDRYDWYLATLNKDGTVNIEGEVTGDESEVGRLKLGFLKDDPYIDDDDVIESINAAMTAKVGLPRDLEGERIRADKLLERRIITEEEHTKRIGEIESAEKKKITPQNPEGSDATDAAT